MLPLNQIVCGRNEQVLSTFPDECIDLTVTSPPYDNLRAYKGFEWDFDATAQQLYRVTNRGGVVVWVVADATVNGSETGTSFRQALRFMEIGFNLHDTMIYVKNSTLPMFPGTNRYTQAFEYMFVFSKDKPKTCNALQEKKRDARQYDTTKEYNKLVRLDGQGGKGKLKRSDSETKLRDNLWFYDTGYGVTTTDKSAFNHDALFPEKLAEDHILSWSNPGDIVLDPFVGSGTTPKMAIRHSRNYIGIDISSEYCDLARKRISGVAVDMFSAFGVS